MSRSVRRWGALAASAALALSLSACGDKSDASSSSAASSSATSSSASSSSSAGSASVPEAAKDGAAWLAGQLENGVLVNHQYKVDDDSTTVEAAYALRAVDPGSSALPAIGKALAKDAKTYTSLGKDVYAGPTGKLLAFASDTGADPTSFGGIDLVKQMEDLTAPSGRIADQTKGTDYANAFGQIWAVRGLLDAKSKEAPAAERFLLEQQCSDGYFRQDFSKADAADQSCAAKDPASIDTTALAVVLLDDQADGDQTLSAALKKAVSWLESQQADDGSFVLNTGATGGASNSDSTGLAGAALRIAGDDAAAAKAATWVRAHQLAADCDGKLADSGGAIAYDDTALAQAAGKGITVKTEYQWRLATAQALPGLLSAPSDAPAAACPSTK